MASSEEDDVMDTVPDEDEDLFGGDDDDTPAEKTRELSDRELDSGDDEDRHDRAPQEEEIDYEGGRDARVMESTVWRHPLPKPVDGEFNSLRLPKFLGIEPRAYDAETFRIPEVGHHSDTRSANFSASAVSASTMRFRKDPLTGKLESNTNIYRWSDGSTTISIGDQQYELQSKPLAPPRTSKTYSENQDSHFYLATPSIASQLLLLVGHMSNQHTVRPNEAVEDDALEKLQKSLAAAARRGNKNEKGPELIASTQDPELQKKRAEIAEKERMRAQRRRETAAEKASQSHRPGVSRSNGGLNLDDLEGRSGRRAPTSGRKPPKPRKRRPDYDSDDDLPKGRSREDEYDMEDDFLAPSDDEEAPEGDDDDEDEEELLDEESDRDTHKSKKQKTVREEDVSDADADAEADLDDEEAPAAPVVTEAAGRGRKRNIIEDDDDE